MTTQTEIINKTPAKIHSLANFLEVEPSEIIEVLGSFAHGNAEYLVLTNEEADKNVRAAILESLWAFNADFISRYTKNGLTQSQTDAIKVMQEKLCEDANDIILALVQDNLENFIAEAISSDGRGHFLSGYDGEENEQDGLYIYRTN